MTNLERDTLFLALTRPALRWGVPFEALLLNGMGSFFIGLWLGNPCYWIIGVILHFPMRVISAHDPNFFRIGRLWMTTKGRNGSGVLWGGSMLSPMSDQRPTKSTERSSCV